MTTDVHHARAVSGDRSAGQFDVPTFIETEPDAFTPIEECSKTQIGAEIMALVGQADAIVADGECAADPEAQALARSLLHNAELLGEYLNV